MKMVVLVKHVPCAAAGLSFAPDLTLDRSRGRAQLSDADACAVEQALRIAVCRSDAQITAVTMGPANAVHALHAALVLGADEGVHLLDDALHGSDALATSRVLAAAVTRIGFDLVLCGSASADSGTAVVPAMLAERLGVPVLCLADALTVSDDRVEIRRDQGAGAETVAAALPAVVSLTRRCGVPRYPAHRAYVQSRHKLVRTWSLSRLGIGRSEVGLAAAATRVRAVRPTGGKARVIVACDPPAAAARLAEFLAERELL
jgi:electron transfer flavoprotein beta subunit